MQIRSPLLAIVGTILGEHHILVQSRPFFWMGEDWQGEGVKPLRRDRRSSTEMNTPFSRRGRKIIGPDVPGVGIGLCTVGGTHRPEQKDRWRLQAR